MEQIWDLATKILRKAEPNIRNTDKGIQALRDLWFNNKNWMFPYLDSNYRMTIDIQGSFNKEDLESAMSEAMRMAYRLSQKERYYTVLLQDHGENAVRFLRHFLNERLSQDEVLDNKLIDKKDDPNREGKFLPAGTKVSKYLASYIVNTPKLFNRGEILSIYGIANAGIVIDFMVDLYSQVISILRKGNDTVAISANPVDIILASSHTHNWRSCHRIFGGEYRTGPLAYLCDEVSLIAFAYRTIDKIDCLDAVWPRKLWRQMIFLDKIGLSAFFSREYPNASGAYARAVRGLGAMLLSKHGNTEYKWKYKCIGRDDCDFDDPNDSGMHDMWLGESPWHYRDRPTSAIRMLPDGKYPRVQPGIEELPCCACGLIRDETVTSELVCEDCNPRLHCYYCGEPVDESDCRSDNEGLYYCMDCWDRHFFQCSCCGQYRRKDESIHITDRSENVCLSCVAKFFTQCDCCGDYYRNSDVATLVNGYKYCEHCIDKHAFYCEVCNEYYPETEQKNVTSDCYTYCSSCESRISKCSECNLAFRYDYAMIDGMCGVCITEKANKEEIGVITIEV